MVDLLPSSIEILRAALDYIHNIEDPDEPGVDFVNHSLEDTNICMMVKGTSTG